MLKWWRRWRRKRARNEREARLLEAKDGTDLREFVYLDSTSVHSLVASRLGPIATEQTENEARNWESKAAGKLGADLAAFDLSASADTLRGGSQSVQVLKKSIVQTTFKDLLDLEGQTLLLGGEHKKERSKFTTLSSKDIIRGSLIELDVELDVEPVFRIATVVSSLLGFIERSPELFDDSTRKQFAEGRAIEGVLRGLLGGLVPIRARVLNYVVVGNGTELSVEKRDATSHSLGEPLFLVGVAEEQLFWKDIRRVLFSCGRYKVLARIAEDGIRDAWTPIKLGHVLEQMVPGFSAQMASQDWDALITQKAQSKLPSPEPGLRGALLRFIELLAEEMGSECSEDAIERARAHAGRLEEIPIVMEAWRVETTTVVDLMLAGQIDRDMLPTLREKARAPVRPRDATGHAPRAERSAKQHHFLDCEFVAIYW